MKSSKTNLLIMAGVLIFAARAAYGDMANGTYSFTPASSNASIWDVSGEYSTDFGTGIEMDFTITQNPDGTFTGSGTFDVEEGNTSLTGDVTASGKVLGSSAKTGVTMQLDVSGSGTIEVDQSGDTDNADLAAKFNVKFGVDGPNQALVTTSGAAALSLHDLVTNKKRSGSEKLQSGQALNIPAGDNGNWSMVLNLTPNGAKYTGTATIGTEPGETANFTATGVYSSKTDTSKITLKGDGGSLSLVISTSGPTMTVQSIKGKVFGQSLNVTNP